METIIDKFGRVIIPKAVREDLGIQAGSHFEVIEDGSNILLKPIQKQNALVVKEGVLVYGGQVDKSVDTVNLVRKIREDRIKKFLPQSSR